MLLVARVGPLLAAEGKQQQQQEEEKEGEGGHCSTGKLSVSPAPRPKAAACPESAASHNFLRAPHSPICTSHIFSYTNRLATPHSTMSFFMKYTFYNSFVYEIDEPRTRCVSSNWFAFNQFAFCVKFAPHDPI